MSLDEKDGDWNLSAYLHVACEHPGGSIDPLLPRAWVELTFLNRGERKKKMRDKSNSNIAKGVHSCSERFAHVI